MSEIASAFVRIRPNMTGFQSEVERGTKVGFSRIAQIAGVAFGAVEAFKFGKDIVGHAADVEKQIEAVKTEFGQASEAILKFSETGAAKLGLSAHVADATAARFGILFKNLNLGHEQAATMTVNFEKLAGSLALIRNVDPSRILTALPLAIAGNLRSLKQMGIATDQTQLKVAAFKLGLTSTITQALTPSQRAQAIYAVATAHLGDFLEQARKHSKDAATQQRILTAEWDNAKDSLGRGLIPVFARLTNFLVTNLPGAIEKVKRSFRTFAGIVDTVTKPVGGLKNAVLALLAAFAIAKLAAFAAAFNPISLGIKALAVEFEVSSAEVVGAFGIMGAAAEGFGLAVKAAISSTLIGAAFVALGLAAEYVITHWSKVKQWFGVFAEYMKRILNGAWQAVLQGSKAAAYAILENFTLAIQGILIAASHLPFIGKYARRALNGIQDALNVFKPDFSAISEAFAGGGDQAGKAFADAARKQIHAQVSTFGGTLPGLSALLGKQVNDAVSGALLVKPKTDKQIAALALKQALADQGTKLHALRDQYQGLVTQQDAGITKIKNQLKTLDTSLADAVKQQNKDLADAVNQARTNLSSLGSSLDQMIAQYLDKPLNDIQNKINALQNRQSLENLRKSVILPGTKQLSTDPNKALAQLNALAAKGASVNQGAIKNFVTQYRTALLSVKQDQVAQLKDATSKRIANLTDSFNRGHIGVKQFQKGVLGLLSADHVNYRKAGARLGSAFVNGLRDTVKGLIDQSGALGKINPKLVATVQFSTATIVHPLEAIKDDQKTIAGIQRQIRDKHGALQARIAKNADKQTRLLEQINSVQLGATASSVAKNPGKQSKTSKTLAGTTH